METHLFVITRSGRQITVPIKSWPMVGIKARVSFHLISWLKKFHIANPMVPFVARFGTEKQGINTLSKDGDPFRTETLVEPRPTLEDIM
jgi:hypothetical protein